MITSMSQSQVCTVQKYIGSDFDHVITVAEGMEDIKEANANIDHIKEVNANIAPIKNVSDNMEHVVEVSENMDAVKSAAEFVGHSTDTIIASYMKAMGYKVVGDADSGATLTGFGDLVVKAGKVYRPVGSVSFPLTVDSTTDFTTDKWEPDYRGSVTDWMTFDKALMDSYGDPQDDKFAPDTVSNLARVRALINLVNSRANTLPVTATGSVTSRTLSDRFSDEASVKDFGAKGDGITDDTTAIQLAVDSIPDGSALVFPLGVYKVGVTATVNVTNKKGIRFIGEGTVKLADNTQVRSSRAMFYFTNCEGCDFELRLDGNNKNNTNDTNESIGLVSGVMMFDCIDCNIQNGRVKDCNNVAYYLSTGCVNCTIRHNYTVDSFGTDYKLGGETNRACQIYNNIAMVTRNIHSEKPSGTTGKQDGFVAVQYKPRDAKVFNNVCRSTNDAGIEYGDIAYGLWVTDFSGSFESYNNRWEGCGDPAIAVYLRDTHADTLYINDTTKATGGSCFIGTLNADEASIKHIEVSLNMHGGTEGIKAINTSKFTLGSGEITINAFGLTGASVVSWGKANTSIKGVIDHTNGTSHPIYVEADGCIVRDCRIKMGTQVARGINLTNAKGCLVSGNVITGNANISIREMGACDYNLITNNITNTNVITSGANSVAVNNIVING